MTAMQVACFVSGASWGLGLRVPSGPEWPAQALTSLLAHADAPHLAGNLASQLALGWKVEGMHGSGRFAVVYAVGGALGAACFRTAWRVTDGETEWVLVGASPAVYALMGAHSAHVALNWTEAPLIRWLLVAAVALTAAVDVSLYFAYPLPNVAYSSHAGGAAFGALVGVLVLRNVRVLEWERTLRRCAALLLLSGTCAVLVV